MTQSLPFPHPSSQHRANGVPVEGSPPSPRPVEPEEAVPAGWLDDTAAGTVLMQSDASRWLGSATIPSTRPAGGAPVAGQASVNALVAPAVSSFGAPGKRRRPMGVALLAVCTLGGSAVVWHRRVQREIVSFDPRMVLGQRRFGLALLIPWLAPTMVAVAIGPLLLAAGHGFLQLPDIVKVALPWGFLAPLVTPYLMLLLPFSAVALVMGVERLRVLEDHLGVPTDRQVRPVRRTCWLLFPVVGALVFLVRQQRRLNQLWETLAG